MKKLIFILVLLLVPISDLFSQNTDTNKVSEIFSTIHIINGHSTETLKQRQWRYIIGHRFGDVSGGAQTAFGFDDAADIRFGFDFGLTDELMVGISRLKGSGSPYRSIIEGFAKYRFLDQKKDNSIPVSLSLASTVYGTYMPSSGDPNLVTDFSDFAHRFAYASQITVARKFHPRLSIALMPSHVHRNIVHGNDVNSLFALGGAVNFKLFKKLGLVAEHFQTFSPSGMRENYENSTSFALEWITNGHNFSFNFTNARGFGELQYIALTGSDWLQGQFRFGFSITRTFKY